MRCEVLAWRWGRREGFSAHFVGLMGLCRQGHCAVRAVKRSMLGDCVHMRF